MRLRHALFALSALLSAATASEPARAQTVVTDLPTSMGTERAAFLPASTPRATVILLAGGEGVVQIGPGGEAATTIS
jgi:hypothetical protein